MSRPMSDETPRRTSTNLGVWTAIGIGMGVGIGVAMGNVGIGIAIGLGLDRRSESR